MYWRDKVILEVAKKMYERLAKASNLPSWDDCNKTPWIAAAENAIKDVRDGSKAAGWNVEFVKDLP